MKQPIVAITNDLIAQHNLTDDEYKLVYCQGQN